MRVSYERESLLAAVGAGTTAARHAREPGAKRGTNVSWRWASPSLVTGIEATRGIPLAAISLTMARRA